jgi:RNA polymerase sigma-70 factor (ECF subfamily)
LSDVRAEIYNTYKKDIFSYFYKATLNYHNAEDLTEDTFLRVFKFFSSFRGESSVKTWLYKIARNVLSDFLSKNSLQSEEIEENTLADTSDEYNTLEKKLIIKKVMDKLSEEERTLIILRDVNGLSYLEISKIMNYTEGQVKIGIHRARKKFKELYLKEMEV